MQPPLLGQLLLDFGLVTEEQLKSALEVQRRDGTGKKLGDILVELGVITEASLNAILQVHARKRGAGDADALAEPDAELSRRLDGKPLAEFLRVARDLKASDLHLTAGIAPTLRIDGELRTLRVAPLTAEDCARLIAEALSPEELARVERERSLDSSLEEGRTGRFRVHVFRHGSTLAAVFRSIASTAWRFDQLGLSPTVLPLCRLDTGLVLITGTIGSGKSTTLAALLDVINTSRDVHVVTIEDPIEVVFDSDRALVSQREVGTHTKDFASALRAALREDPDVLVVGEMRDLETTAIALTAAETGHLVFGTMHTGSADRTIHRVLDQFPAHQRDHARAVLANVLRTIICQQLVPSADGQGRALAAEILNVTPAIANLIREDRMHQIPTLMQMGRRDGMVLMDDSLAALVRARKIRADEALRRALDPDKLQLQA